MRKYLLPTIALILGIIAASLFLKNGICPLNNRKQTQSHEISKDALNDAVILLKFRKDNDALAIFEKILKQQPDNLDALCGKAEVLRRARDYCNAEELLARILKEEPNHASALVSLAHLRYKQDKLEEATALINRILRITCLDKENGALAYMILGGVRSRYCEKAIFFKKIRYGLQIKRYFLKAKELAPQLPEVHFGLGSFYLLAPAVIGGNLEKAIKELEFTVKIAPEFATANARLAQAYKKKGEINKYNFYIQRAKELDPQNELLND